MASADWGNLIGAGVVLLAGAVVTWDLVRLARHRHAIPGLGNLPGGGYAWEASGPSEVARQWANLLTLGGMMVLPWPLAQGSGTSIGWVVTFDVLLMCLGIGMVLPKRYAVTRTHLFVDGHEVPWSRLRLAKRQPSNRLMLHRHGWGPLAPLPLGGNPLDLARARVRIEAVKEGTWWSHDEES